MSTMKSYSDFGSRGFAIDTQKISIRKKISRTLFHFFSLGNWTGVLRHHSRSDVLTSKKMRSGPLQIVKLLLAIKFALLVFFGHDSAQALIGNIGVRGFKIPCAVACGGNRGIVNLNFAGDVINSVFVGPSIDNFEGSANRASDRAIQQLDSILTNQKKSFLSDVEKIATQQRESFVAQLTDISFETISMLDDKLRLQIMEADRVLENRLGTLDALLSKHTTEFTYSFRRVAISVIILLAISFIFYKVYQHVVEKKLPMATALPTVLWGLAATVVFSLVAYGFTTANERLAKDQLLSYYKDGFKSSLSNINLDHAVYYSAQLYFLDRKNKLFQAQFEKSTLLRDVFTRPALYKTVDGSREMLYRLGNAQLSYVQSSGRLDSDLSILYGFLIWQRGDDRFSEYNAAAILASTIEDIAQLEAKEEKKEFVTLLPFAYYYLNSYLANPLSDEVISHYYQRLGVAPESVFAKISTTIADKPAQENLMKKRYKISELQKVVAGLSIDLDGLAKRFQLYAYVRVGVETMKTHRAVVTRYTELLRLTGQMAVSTTDQQKADVRARIRLIASEVVTNWDAYLTFLVESEFDDNAAKMNTLKSLWPIYTRALVASKLPDTADSWGAGDPTKGIHKRWLSDVVRPSVRASAYRLISVATDNDYAMVDAKLDSLEKAMKVFFENGAKLATADKGADVPAKNSAAAALRTTALQVASAGTDLGLFGCANRSTGTFDCRLENAEPISFAQLIFEAARGVTPKILENEDLLVRLVRTRTLPAI